METASQDHHTPSLEVASPTFSYTTLSTLEGDGTPSARESLVAVSYVDISSDESYAAELRWSHAPDPSQQQQSYRLPDGSEWPLCKELEITASLNAAAGEARERSRLEAIHSELGYLGDSIH